MSATIGVDLGGTKILAARVDASGSASGHQKAPTSTDGPDRVIESIIDLVRRVEDLPAAIGIGVPGPVSEGVLLHAPNLVGFDAPVGLAARVGEALGCPVVLGNDASLGTLGEARHGAAKGGDNVLGCWLGTGIGGGLVLSGRLHVGAHGAAGEIGHVPVTLDGGPECGCGRKGCVEAYAGRSAMEAAAHHALAEGEDSQLERIRKKKGKKRYTSGVWRSALKKDDPLATRLMDTAVAALGVALAGVINVVDVDTIVFGGGISEKLGQAHADRIAAAARPHLIAPDLPRRWVVASLKDDSGVIGAAEHARDVLAS